MGYIKPSGYRSIVSPYPALSAYVPALCGKNFAWLPSTVGPVYSLDTDPLIMARYRASDGAADISTSGIGLGPLVATSGAVSIGADSDGNAVWQLRSGSGGFLKTAGGATVFYNPITVILIAKAGPAPASNQCWLTTSGVASSIYWASAAGLKLTGASSAVIASVPANENVFSVYEHNNVSSAGVNGSAFAALTAVGGNVGIINTNLTLGGDPSGSNRADVDIAEVIVYEGPATAQFLTALTAYVRRRYPSRGMSAVVPSPPSPWQLSRGAMPAGAFDYALFLGQSNNDGLHSLTGVPTAAGALAYNFKPDNSIIACPALYGDPTNTIDGVNVNALAGVGGNATAFAAAYTASTARSLLVVPCALGGSQLVANWWPLLVRGNKKRNCLYGMALDRARNIQSLGGRLVALVWYQGESEAQIGGALLANYQTNLDFMLSSFFRDLGIPEKTLIQTVANTVAGATAPNLAAMQAVPGALAALSGGTRRALPPSSGPYEADNLHLQASAQNAVGAAMAASAIAAGW